MASWGFVLAIGWWQRPWTLGHAHQVSIFIWCVNQILWATNRGYPCITHWALFSYWRNNFLPDFGSARYGEKVWLVAIQAFLEYWCCLDYLGVFRINPKSRRKQARSRPKAWPLSTFIPLLTWFHGICLLHRLRFWSFRIPATIHISTRHGPSATKIYGKTFVAVPILDHVHFIREDSTTPKTSGMWFEG